MNIAVTVPEEYRLFPRIPRVFREIVRPRRYKVFFGGRGGGKCLALGTKVVMADGSLRAVEDIREGDSLMGPDSLPRTVLSIARGYGPLYLVQQTSGIDYVVNDAHLLSLKKSKSAKSDIGEISRAGNARRPNGRYGDWPDVATIRADLWSGMSKRWCSHFRGWRTGCIDLPLRPVTIDPYFLGVWLGDGTSRTLQITTADHEIGNYCKLFAVRHGLGVTTRAQPNNASVILTLTAFGGPAGNPIWKFFKDYGLANNKHIPDDYLLNSEFIRLRLLAGLIDTDGWNNGHNGYEIAQVNELLAKQIKHLADLLGFRTSIKKKSTVCGNNRVKGVAWVVRINGNTWRIPCKVQRKKIKKRDVRKNKDFLLSEVTVSYHGEGEWAGFELDGDRLFLLEDGTVTHNTTNIARIIIGLCHHTFPTAEREGKTFRVLCGREFQASIADSVHFELVDAINHMRLTYAFRVTDRTIRSRQTGAEILFRGVHHNFDQIKSLGGIDLFWGEEAHSMSEDSLIYLDPTIRRDPPLGPFGAGSELWFTLNQHEDNDPIYTRIARGYFLEPGDALIVPVTWKDNPYFPIVLEKQRAAMEREDDQGIYEWVWGTSTRRLGSSVIYKGRYVVDDFETPANAETLRFFHGADWGFSTDPTCLIRCYEIDNELYIDQEAYGYGIELEEIPALFAGTDTERPARWKNPVPKEEGGTEVRWPGIPTSLTWPIKADNARPEIISYIRRRGFSVAAAEKWPGSVEDGIAHVKGFKKIHIHQRCKNTAREVRLYSYKVDKQTGEVLPVVVSKHDHALDAVRYSLDGYIQRRGGLAIWERLADQL